MGTEFKNKYYSISQIILHIVQKYTAYRSVARVRDDVYKPDEKKLRRCS